MIARALFLAIVLFSETAQAATTYCSIVDEALLQMKVAEANIANAETTHIPGGGPYRKKSVFCNDGTCQVEELASFYEVYQPDHPDAKKNGMVTFPKINPTSEMAIVIGFQHAYDHAKPLCDSERL